MLASSTHMLLPNKCREQRRTQGDSMAQASFHHFLHIFMHFMRLMQQMHSEHIALSER